MHHEARMLSLTWVLNSTTVTAIQLFLTECINHSGISRVDHMADKTCYPLPLNLCQFIDSQQKCSA